MEIKEFKPYSKMIKYKFRHLTGKQRDDALKYYNKQDILEACDIAIDEAIKEYRADAITYRAMKVANDAINKAISGTK